MGEQADFANLRRKRAKKLFQVSVLLLTLTGLEYQSRLRDQQEKLAGSNDLFSWARTQTTKDSSRKESLVTDSLQASELDPIQKLLQSTTAVFENKSSVLKTEKLVFSKLVNANYGHEHGSVITSTCFHPTENLLLTSGLDRKVKIF